MGISQVRQHLKGCKALNRQDRSRSEALSRASLDATQIPPGGLSGLFSSTKNPAARRASRSRMRLSSHSAACPDSSGAGPAR